MITKEELFISTFPRDQQDFLRVLSGTDRGFFNQFLGSLRAIVKGDLSGLRRLKKSGEPYYDVFTGTWRDFNGQKLNTDRQIKLEIAHTKRQLTQVTREAIRADRLDSRGRPTIPPELINKWQRKVGKIITESNIRAYGIGFGNPKVADYQKIEGHTFNQIKYLEEFAKQLEMGELKKYDPISRISMYADSILQGYSKGDIDGRDSSIFEGWRQLDPYAAHCPECPGYATDGYVNLSDLMPIGNCSTCMARCKCTIKWRKKKEMYYSDLVGVNADLLSKGKIAEINFQYYARMGLKTKEQARRYSILKRSLGHAEALNQVKMKYNL